ncbi:MAG TPA: hypothetical protein VFE46_07090 [Pirellulales bacterium]|jgi:hypothetical protein|nr:hypothetical protein [Pirellulales bacterium]
MFRVFKGQRNRLPADWKWNAAVGLFAAALSLAAAGCGSSKPEGLLTVYPAEGKVSFKGAVPQGAYVALHPKTNFKAPNGQAVVPTAQVQPDGTFALSSYGADDGAPEGEYVLTAEWHKTVKGAGGDPVLGPNLLPPQYSKPATSPLKVTIVAGKNELPPIVLK